MSDFRISHADTNQIDDAVIQTHTNTISEYRDQLQSVVQSGNYNQPESAINLPDDATLVEQVSAAIESLPGSGLPSIVIVVGMGGSSRGTKAIYELLASSTDTQMQFLDTVSEHRISDVVDGVHTKASDLQDIAVCVVSKSGTTAETMANFSALVDMLAQRYDRQEAYKQSVAITDPGSPLESLAQSMDMTTVHIPDQVGGRFSVLSAVGLVPLSLAGLPVDELMNGAADMRDACLSGRVLSDPAAVIAAILYEHSQNARRILNHFFFTQSADTLGKWSAQLFAESLGKRKNRQGEPVFAGLYPTTSIGPDDLHSLFQLQLGGPKNFVSLLVRETDPDRGDLTHELNSNDILPDKLEHLVGESLGELQQALGESVATAFAEDDRPFIEITVPELDAYHIGQFILLEEIVVMYLGDLFNINAFNQPEVENYKQQSREILMTDD